MARLTNISFPGPFQFCKSRAPARLFSAISSSLILERVILARGQLSEAMQTMLNCLHHASNQDVRVSDFRKSHIVELCRRQPRRRRRLEDCRALPGAFESFANPDVVLRGFQSGYEYAVGPETQESFGPLERGVEPFCAICIRASFLWTLCRKRRQFHTLESSAPRS